MEGERKWVRRGERAGERLKEEDVRTSCTAASMGLKLAERSSTLSSAPMSTSRMQRSSSATTVEGCLSESAGLLAQEAREQVVQVGEVAHGAVGEQLAHRAPMSGGRKGSRLCEVELAVGVLSSSCSVACPWPSR